MGHAGDTQSPTPEMIQAGADALDDVLWKLDPNAKPFGRGVLTLIAARVGVAMLAAREGHLEGRQLDSKAPPVD